MRLRNCLRFVTLLAFLSPCALAQTGTLDQVSPLPGGGNASYNGDATSLTWQAQVACGLTGQFEGFSLTLTGVVGATLLTSVRVGPGWNTTPTLFTSLITKTTAATETVFVNTTSANINVVPGTRLVIEMIGQGTGAGMLGSYVAPTAGSPLYPEFLYLNGPGCFADCGWRIGFSTYVLVGGGSSVFCFGDGSGTACPCTNASLVGGDEACLNSAGLGGRLRATGVASLSADTVSLAASNLPGNVPTYLFQGTARVNGGAGLTFGDGLRCVGGTIVGLGIHSGVGGVATYPMTGDLPVGLRGGCVAGGTYHYQGWYRNAATFCTSSTFNLTNGATLLWTP